MTGFIIMEPDMRRSRIRRRRCLGTKRVSGWSRLALGCHAQTIRERERERHRRVSINNNIKEKEKNGTYA